MEQASGGGGGGARPAVALALERLSLTAVEPAYVYLLLHERGPTDLTPMRAYTLPELLAHVRALELYDASRPPPPKG